VASAALVLSLRAEWTKLRTVPSTGWLLLGAVAVTVMVGASYVESINTSHCPSPTECVVDTARFSLVGVRLGQAVLAVLAVLAITNEYGTRMICTTLATNPRRIVVLLAKAGVVSAVVLAAGTLAVAGSLLAGRLLFLGNGFTAANGHPPLSLADGATLRAAAGSVLYLGLIALLSLGVGIIVRDTAGAITTVLGVLYLVPLAAAAVSDPLWLERLHRFGPTTAGLAIQTTIDVDSLPIGPWQGLGVLAAYTAAALLLGTILFTTRDA
jgi:ABC-2 type transport system permease protein